MGVVIGWIILGLIAAVIASNKGRSFAGWFCYGFLIAPVAIVHALVVKDRAVIRKEAQEAFDSKTCPRCAEKIRRAAKVCRFCGTELGDGFDDDDDTPMLPPDYKPDSRKFRG